MDPTDAADLARRVRAAVVEEIPRNRWVLPVVALLVLAILALIGIVLGT